MSADRRGRGRKSKTQETLRTKLFRAMHQLDVAYRKALKFLEKMCLFSVSASSSQDSFLYLVASMVTDVILNVAEEKTNTC